MSTNETLEKIVVETERLCSVTLSDDEVYVEKWRVLKIVRSHMRSYDKFLELKKLDETLRTSKIRTMGKRKARRK